MGFKGLLFFLLVFLKYLLKEGDYIGKQLYDYSQAETEYVTTKCSYAFLSDKYAIPLSSITKYAKEHCWREKRKKHCENVAAKSSEKIASQQANKMASLINASDRAAKAIESALADGEQLYRYVVTENTGDFSQKTSEYTFRKMDTKALRDIVSSLKDLTAVIRNLNEIPTEAEKEARKIAKERLRLDKKKAESGADKLDKDIIVEFVRPNNENTDT